MEKPDVDHIEGLSPAISIEQKTTSRNPRSTVGTVTEIYDYMRLLWARVGIPYSPATGLPIESQTVSQMVDAVMAMPEGSRLYLLAPIVRGRKGEYRKEFLDLQKRGFQRVKVNGEIYLVDEAPALDKKFKHDIDVVVDRIVLGGDLASRLADSIETALELADGLLFVENADNGERTTFSARFACPVSGFTIDEIEPRLFSFNNPFGACPSCDGLGVQAEFDAELVVPNPALRPGRRRAGAVGGHQFEILRPDPQEPCRPLRLQAVDAVWEAAQEGPGGHPVRLRRRPDRDALRRRAAQIRDDPPVRRRDPEPGPDAGARPIRAGCARS